MKYIKYLFAYISVGLGFFGVWIGGWGAWLIPVYAFVAIPAVELLLEGSKYNLDQSTEKTLEKDRVFDWMVYLIVPLQFYIVLLTCYQLSVKPDRPWWEILGFIFTAGIACGVFGINVAHELGHRTKKYEQFLSKALLLTSLYMHFFIEHNCGHHNRVSTDDDPASSRLNEPLYVFWGRSVILGYVSAWKLEAFRLKKMGRSALSLYNEMIWYTVIEATWVVGIAWFFGFTVIWYFLGMATVGFLLLETVNYIEHYGLRRQKGEHGYHKVLPVHSWNSNHPLGRMILFELSRHSDHHFRANRKYQILRYHEDSPQMPTGYPGMMVLSLVPPLWFKVMNPRVKQLQEKYEEKLAA